MEGDEEGDSWSVHVSKTLKQCVRAATDQPSSTRTCVTGLFATEAADHLSARVQLLDHNGYPQGVGISDRGAVRVPQAQLGIVESLGQPGELACE